MNEQFEDLETASMKRFVVMLCPGLGGRHTGDFYRSVSKYTSVAFQILIVMLCPGHGGRHTGGIFLVLF